MRSAILLVGILIFDGLVKKEIPLEEGVAMFLALFFLVFFAMDLYELIRERK